MHKWYDKAGKYEDVVISSRIRLARNFNDYKFADRLKSDDATKMVNDVVARFQRDHSEEYNYIFLNNCNESRRHALKERRSISSYLANGHDGAVILSADEGVSVMLNAEDHVRIQVLANGMNMPVCYKRANDVDDYIDSNFDYAFDEKYGYKTTFPTNVGTGMRAGYTLHLPALAEAKRLTQISTELGRFGIKFKVLYDDGEGSLGDLYQISNQRTLGQNEKEIIRDIDDIVMQIAEQEREQRSYFYDNGKIQTEDEIYKSYGVLRYARKLNLRDAMMLISEFMLGISLGILAVDKDEQYSINKILMDIQPAVLCDVSGRSLSVDETDVLRAQYLRNNFPNII